MEDTTAPDMHWRTLGAGGRTKYFITEQGARESAQDQVNQSKRWVGIEHWSLEHPQDELNRGWAMVDTVQADPIETLALAEAVLNAVDDMAEGLRNIGPGPFNHASCDEAASVSAVLRAAGHTFMAEHVLLDHVDGDDDCEDTHHDGYLAAHAFGIEPNTCKGCELSVACISEGSHEWLIVTPNERFTEPSFYVRHH